MKSNKLSAAILALAVVAFPGTGHAVVDDAHSFAMEAAIPYVEQHFRVRSDYWSGELKLGEQKAVRHQLFRGNLYCFWLGTDTDNLEIEIGIYDLEGNAMEIKVVDSNHATTAQILPPATGSYVIVFSMKRAEGAPEEPPVDKDEEKLPIGWALAYGYR